MKLTIMQDLLKQGLDTVKPAVASRSTLPVLTHVLLGTTEEGGLDLAATNLEIAIVTRASARVASPGVVTLPARLLSEFVAALPSGADVDVILNDRTMTATLECGGYGVSTRGGHRASIKGLDAAEFPHVPTAEDWEAENVKPVRLPAAAFKALASRVAFAAATEEARPTLTGVLCEMSDAGVTFAAADGFRLAVGSDTSWQARDAKAIIPARALSAAAATVNGAEFVELYLRPEQAMFSAGKTVVVSQLIGGNFPDYRQIVPKSHATRATFDAAAMRQAVKVAGFFARDAANLVRLVVDSDDAGNGVIVVSGSSVETGDGATEVDAGVDGPSLEIAFNARYLLDALNAVGTERAALEMTAASSPGVLRAVGDDAWLCVLMPMHVTR